MKDRVRKWLLDIQTSIKSVKEYLGEQRNFFDYQQNKMLKRAVEREFEIIGEATNRILQHVPDIEISSARKIVGLRNHIIHAYDSVSDEIIWGIIVNNLPALEAEVEILLEGEYSE